MRLVEILLFFSWLFEVGNCYDWESLNLLPQHIPMVFNNNQWLKDECERDTTCPYKNELNSNLCWGYEENCKERYLKDFPQCPTQQELDKYWSQADFGKVKESLFHMKKRQICKPKDGNGASMTCTKDAMMCRAKYWYLHIPLFSEWSDNTPLVPKDGAIGAYCELDQNQLSTETNLKQFLCSEFAQEHDCRKIKTESVEDGFAVYALATIKCKNLDPSTFTVATSARCRDRYKGKYLRNRRYDAESVVVLQTFKGRDEKVTAHRLDVAFRCVEKKRKGGSKGISRRRGNGGRRGRRPTPANMTSLIMLIWPFLAACIFMNLDECTRRWEGIRDKYRREIDKREKAVKSASGQQSGGCWEMLKTLQFISPFTAPRNTSSNVCDETPPAPQIIKSDRITLELDNSDLSERGQENESGSLRASSPIRRKKKRKNSSDVEKILHAIEAMPLPAPDPTADDADELFLRSLLPDLRALPQTKKLQVKMQIMQIIAESAESV